MTRKLLIAAALLAVPEAFAHQAPAGWAYPYACCSEQDCREVPASSVRESPYGYLVPTGELLKHGDRRLKSSPDGLYHWCSTGSTTRCLFVPVPAT